MLDVVEQFHRQIADRLDDFHRHWYLGHRFQYRPIVGYTNAPFRSKTLNIGDDGFRGGTFALRSATGSLRIGCFGASSVMGIPNCADHETMPAQLSRCSGYETLNFGIPVYNSAREANAVFRGVLDYDLGAVVLMSGFNDFHTAAHGVVWDYEDIAAPSREAFDPRREDPLWHLQRAWDVFRKNRSRPRTTNRQEYQKQMTKRRVRRIFNNSEPTPIYDYAVRFFETHVGLAAVAARKANLPFMFIAQANLYSTQKPLSNYETEVSKSLMEFGIDEERQARIDRFSKYYRVAMTKARAAVSVEGGLSFDADELLASQGKDCTVFHDACHLTPSGCEIVARAIAEKLPISVS